MGELKRCLMIAWIVMMALFSRVQAFMINNEESN
jgi:hypothetical protein